MAWTAENDLYLETHHNLFTRVVEQIATLEFFTITPEDFAEDWKRNISEHPDAGPKVYEALKDVLG